MNTALVTHAYLDLDLPGYRGQDGQCRRVQRWLHHYRDCWPTVVLDNGSAPETCWDFAGRNLVGVVNLQPNYPRGKVKSNDYPNVWRAYYAIRNGVLPNFDRVFYIATDAYVLSQRLMDWMDGIEEGWTALWSERHTFPEAQFQVITKCPEFMDFFAGEFDPAKFDTLCEETTLPFTHIEKGFIGDRYGEFHPRPPYRGIEDFWAQVPDLDWDDSVFPVVRRKEDKLVVAPC